MADSKYIRSVFEWDHFLVYLAGAIDFAVGGGRDWREDWTKSLVEIGMKPQHILNPCKKPLVGTSLDLDNEAELIAKHREAEDWDGLCEVVDQIMHVDLRLVDKSDLILANFPLDKNGNRVFTVGTIHEIVKARQERKPVFVVWEGGKKTCSGWLMKLVGHRNVFGTFEEVKETLEMISNGKQCYNAKDWLLINFNKNQKPRMIKYGSES